MLAEILTGTKEESGTVKMATQMVINMKTFEDRYLSNGGGLEASRFPHARISRFVFAMVKLSTRFKRRLHFEGHQAETRHYILTERE